MRHAADAEVTIEVAIHLCAQAVHRAGTRGNALNTRVIGPVASIRVARQPSTRSTMRSIWARD